MTLDNYTNQEEKSKNLPIDSINTRGINVAVWEHGEADKKYRQVTIKKFYKDQTSEELKETQSLNIHDLPILIQQLQDIYSRELRKKYEVKNNG